MVKRGYIAMLAVDKNYRKRKIGATLVSKAIEVTNIDVPKHYVLYPYVYCGYLIIFE
jgi:peptide alpha-N-acetyltransferase